MGSDLEGILNSPIGQPIAQIFYNSFGQKGALALWSLVNVAQYVMGSSCLLVGSRQTFAFTRDGGLPFTRYLYQINSYTRTPVNTVWLDALLALTIGPLVFTSTQVIVIDAMFTLTVTSSYISYIILILTGFAFKNDFKPGPFNLGKFSFLVVAIAVSWMVFMNMVLFFPATPQTTVKEMNDTVVVLGGFRQGVDALVEDSLKAFRNTSSKRTLEEFSIHREHSKESWNDKPDACLAD